MGGGSEGGRGVAMGAPHCTHPLQKVPSMPMASPPENEVPTASATATAITSATAIRHTAPHHLPPPPPHTHRKAAASNTIHL